MTATILEFPTAAIRAAREAAALDEMTNFAHRHMASLGVPVTWEFAEWFARDYLERNPGAKAPTKEG